MKDIKIKESGGAPRVLDSAARAPKELMRRNLISTKKQAEQTAASEQYDESPVEYAGNCVERATEDTAHHAGEQAKQTVKKTVQKANDTRRLRKETRQYADGGTECPRSSFSSESSATRQGRERASQNYQRTRRAQQTSRQTAQHGIRTTKTTAETTQQTAKAAKGTFKTAQQTAKAAKGTVKTAQRTVKTAKATVKTAQKSVKTVQTAAKATQRAAQAAAKAAQTAAKAAQAAAKAAAAAAKVAAKAIAAVIKAIIAAVKAIIAAIAAGGWVAVVVIIVVVLIVALLAVFGVFSANESADGSKPMTEAIETINAEFQTSVNGRIAELSGDSGADIVEIIYEGDMESLDSPAPNWADVIGVYSAKTSFDPENPADVTVVNDENIERLRTVFYDMNSVSYRTETETDTRTVTDEYGAIVLDENGDPVIETTTTLYIYVNVVSIDYRDGAEHYSFNADQNEVLAELMRPEYYPLFAELIGDTVGDGGEYGLGLDINPDLSPNELGTQLVEAAKKYIGRSYSSMDCSKLVRTAYNDCGLSSMNGLTSTGMAQKCNEMGVLFTDASELQAGDLIFFARKDASRGEGYCTDTRAAAQASASAGSRYTTSPSISTASSSLTVQAATTAYRYESIGARTAPNGNGYASADLQTKKKGHYMNKKTIIRAAVIAALTVIAVVLGITAFSSPPDKDKQIIMSTQPTATPELVVLQTVAPTASPTPIPTPVPTEETGETPAPTKKPATTAQSGTAFSLKIKDRAISVAHGVDEATLDETPGWLPTSASPGEDGMCVVYGHRNRTHLKVLEKVEHGDAITATMPNGTVHTYTVSNIQIYESTADMVLPTVDGKTMVLVTCYPFRYSGNAPGKCVVTAVLH